jgi:hypothetical protein
LDIFAPCARERRMRNGCKDHVADAGCRVQSAPKIRSILAQDLLKPPILGEKAS